MLRMTVARIRIFFAVMGCAILGASLVDWAQSLRTAESGYAWVNADSANTPAIEAAEIWQASARCIRPFFVNALLRSKARLKAFYDIAPAEVRALRTAGGEGPRVPGAQAEAYRLVSDRQDTNEPDPALLDRGAMLHARYAEWYANVFKLKLEEHQWEQRLSNVADQNVTLGEATRRSFSAGRAGESDKAAGDFDRNLLVLLGLGGFPADQEQALRSRCVTIFPVKKVFRNASYLGELYRWPLDYAAAFSFGLELLLLAIFFVPIDLWLGTGDARAAMRYIGEVVAHVAKWIFARGRKLVSGLAAVLLNTLRTIAVGTRAIFTARINSTTVGQIWFLAKLVEIKLPNDLALVAAGNTVGKTVEWFKRAGANNFDDRFA